MNEERSPEEIIRIPLIPSIRETLTHQVHHPSELDEATKNLNIPASLLNFYLATPLDLSPVGLGPGVLIPVQISEREGGRKSLFYLKEGEETLVGIYVTNQGIVLGLMQRVTGNTLPAQTDDTYLMRLTNREGVVIFQGMLKIEVTDASAGEATFHPITDGLRPFSYGKCYIWSLVTNYSSFRADPTRLDFYYNSVENYNTQATVRLTNDSDGDVQWHAVISVAPPSSQVGFFIGIAPADHGIVGSFSSGVFTIEVGPKTLPSGTYEGEVAINWNNINLFPILIPVTFTVQ